MYCLALDVGERRTGVAIGEVLARPLTTLERRSKEEDSHPAQTSSSPSSRVRAAFSL